MLLKSSDHEKMLKKNYKLLKLLNNYSFMPYAGKRPPEEGNPINTTNYT